MVWLCCSIMPPNFWFMPSTRALMPVAASTEPLLTMSITSGTLLPILSASICHAGIPASVSCSISSDWIRLLAAIWPRAKVTRSIPSAPRPTPAAASPTAVSVGITCSAVKPNAKNFCAALVTWLNSKGVAAAKPCSSFVKAAAFCALPSILVKAVCTFCSLPAASTAFTPAAAIAAPIPAIARAARLDTLMKSLPNAERI